ncbi:MAG: kelch repeat-containing protein [Phycisphaerales bacterium]
MNLRTLHFIVALCLLILPSGLATQTLAQTPQWRLRDQTVQPSFSSNHAMSYDSDRERVVLFRSAGTGFGSETWEWDGTAWARRSTSGPSERTYAKMCYDSARGRTVLFGGTSGSGETWEWDGTSWSLRSTSGPTRYFHAMAFDAVRARTVIHGGFNGARLADTWEWDGSTWTQVATTGPGLRQQHMMTFDAARARVVLFGGYGATNTAMGDLWEWDGSEWSLLNDSGPLASDSALVADSVRQRLVLFSGWPSPGLTWEWDGSAWAQVADAGPPPRINHAMAFDEARGEAVLFGGFSATDFGGYTDTWAWNGTQWTRKPLGPYSFFVAMAFDAARNRTLTVSNLSSQGPTETWEWDGSQWHFATATGPRARANAALAFNPVDGRALYFGGRVYSFLDYFYFDDTWEWDGVSWSRLDIAGPSERAGAAMAYDADRGRFVLFGGAASEDILTGETWEWDGAQWALVSDAGPSSREGASMIYDPVRQRILLFGGQSNPQFPTYHNDTWEWDGVTWTQAASAGPSPRSYATMWRDPARGRTFLLGGAQGQTDTWEWSGSMWTEVAYPPAPFSIAGAAFDSARGQLVAFGNSSQTWEFGIECPADFNRDSMVTSQDFFDFLAALFAVQPTADFNHDGSINSQDFFDFIGAFFAGCL